MQLVPLGCHNNNGSVVDPTSTAKDMSPRRSSDMTTTTTPPPLTVDMSTVQNLDMTSAPPTRIRFAHLSPDKAPIDICLAPQRSGQFSGPLLKPAGVAQTGLAYAQVTKYLSIASGPYDLRVVDGGDSTCAHSLFEATNLPAFTPNGSFTVVGTGFTPPNASNPMAFAIVVYSDDSAGAANTALLRFIHEAPDVPTLDLGTGAGSGFAPLLSNVSYRQAGASTTLPIDANGYVSLMPATPPITFSLRVHSTGTDALTVTSGAALPAGAVTTVFAIGDFSGSPRPLQTLICSDSAAPVGALSACTTLP
jgi:hypothetical protein